MRRNWHVLVVLAAATVAVYWQVTGFEFVNYDDPAYVSANPTVQQGLTWRGVAWAFGNLRSEATYWHPLTWLSHMLDCQLFGLRPAGHHGSNLLFHTLNTLLLFLLLERLTGQRGRSAVVAALFALHPLQVDSVAWVAERKNVLSTLFWLLSLLAYVRYAGRPGWARYLPVVVLMSLGLMVKPTLVTLPCVMLLLDFWPLRRLTLFPPAEAPPPAPATDPGPCPPGHHPWASLGRLVLEKVPLLVLAAASSLITIRAHVALGALMSTQEISLPARLANAVVAYAIYLRKLLWPVDLSVFYLHPGRWPPVVVVECSLLLLGLTAVVLAQARRRPYLVVGWLWFLGTLVPAIGLVQAHVQALADRFAYVPVIGVFIMLVWGVAEWADRRPERKQLPRGLAGLALAGCVVMSSLQLRHWQNSLTLLEHAVRVQPANFLARVMLGNALFERGQIERALREYQAGLSLRPDSPEAWLRAGVALTQLGRPAEAISHLRAAIEFAPGWPEPRRRLALAYLNQGRDEQARAAYLELVRLMPATAEGYRDLADMLGEGRQYAEAIHYYREALRLKPDFEPVLNNLAWLRATCGRPEFRDGAEAVTLAERACQLSGRRDANLLGTLAAAYAQTGRFAEAVQTVREAQARARASGQDYLLRSQAEMLEKFEARQPFR